MKLKALLGLTTIVAVAAIGSGAAGAKSTPTEYFALVQTSISGPETVVAAGPIAANGHDVAVNRNTKSRFVFPSGTVGITHHKTSAGGHFDRQTCVQTFWEKGTYHLTYGTGAYAHASGSGTYTLSGIFQGCDQNRPPKSFVTVISAHGPLSLK